LLAVARRRCVSRPGWCQQWCQPPYRVVVRSRALRGREAGNQGVLRLRGGPRPLRRETAPGGPLRGVGRRTPQGTQRDLHVSPRGARFDSRRSWRIRVGRRVAAEGGIGGTCPRGDSRWLDAPGASFRRFGLSASCLGQSTISGSVRMTPGSGEAVLRGEAGRGDPGGHPHLVVDGGEVALHGVRAYDQLVGYLGVGEASRDEP
jgi:hypothetical protein